MPDALEKLQELVLDENKVVTYKTLCRTLDIPADEAKQYLSDFFEQYGASHDLSAFYVLIGFSSMKMQSQQCTKIVLVSSDEVDEMKKEYSSLNSMHLYAVQKGKLSDENILYNTDYAKMDRVEGYNKFSCIRNPYIHVQAEQPIVRHIIMPRDTGSAWKPSVIPSNLVVQKKQVNQAPTSKNKSSNLLSMFQKKAEEDSKPPGKADVNKQTTNKNMDEEKKKKTPPVQSKSSTKTSVPTKGDVKYFFAKQAEKPSKSQTKDSNSVASKEAVNNGNKEKESNKAPKEVKSPPKTKSSVNNSKKSKMKLSRSKAKRSNADDSDDDFTHVKKKHKRIVTMDDSDTESENEQEADRAQRELFDSPADPAPMNTSIDADEDVIPPTPPVANGKVKKWKSVTKTYEDDDGFFVTKKERQFVTDSEDSGSENPAPSKTPQPKKELPKTSPVKKKQSSLMNFFKQK